MMWTKLNETMVKHIYPIPNFKGFMVDNVEANWNFVIIIYSSRDMNVGMVEKEHTCLFHYIQLLDVHTKELIELQL
jgi:hypothetical protein